ncbi:hypothetical protein FA95DRAFT_1614205 [Auriscalpium vulgare]|uniref:Uncharacterized protein n=1 Tax=Auriscalpium vulgare TaxID=40419 RepID=A0ACB8R0L4_9AGAM|nr:hypothetical protein FA95DRAFT_1614205 [Auriscalpium vulgare]
MYSTDWTVRSTASLSRCRNTTPDGEAILLTGSTGRLGGHLLMHGLTGPSRRAWGPNAALQVMLLKGDLWKETLGLDV